LIRDAWCPADPSVPIHGFVLSLIHRAKGS
jgi:hypothetical protein